jgi:hypothetical protein
MPPVTWHSARTFTRNGAQKLGGPNGHNWCSCPWRATHFVCVLFVFCSGHTLRPLSHQRRYKMALQSTLYSILLDAWLGHLMKCANEYQWNTKTVVKRGPTAQWPRPSWWGVQHGQCPNVTNSFTIYRLSSYLTANSICALCPHSDVMWGTDYHLAKFVLQHSPKLMRRVSRASLHRVNRRYAVFHLAAPTEGFLANCKCGRISVLTCGSGFWNVPLGGGSSFFNSQSFLFPPSWIDLQHEQRSDLLSNSSDRRHFAPVGAAKHDCS